VEALYTTLIAVFAVLIMWACFTMVYRLFRGPR